MNEPLNDWDKLQSQWQSFEPDIKKIKKKMSWVTWRMGFILFMDIIVVVTYIPFLLMITDDPNRNFLLNSYHYLLGILVVYGAYLDFKIRLPIFRLQGDTTKEVLSLYLERVKAGVLIGKLSKIFSWLLLTTFILWFLGNLFFQKTDVFTEKFSLETGIFGFFWIGLFVVLSYWYQQRKEKEFSRLKELWKDYLE